MVDLYSAKAGKRKHAKGPASWNWLQWKFEISFPKGIVEAQKHTILKCCHSSHNLNLAICQIDFFFILGQILSYMSARSSPTYLSFCFFNGLAFSVASHQM